ncbi:MAG TPA: AzlC family ABC transporter permease [Synergistaceae bacterium]|nr:AzlC family ABC transporter permease [Synergistaceae bacterium]HPJ25857.1 AzlC family ABC transporter permease [Synergistaceae bacterium]HPQ36954.1 AzlC family ABC transporter permease [Synergistaceae bacterium]
MNVPSTRQPIHVTLPKKPKARAFRRGAKSVLPILLGVFPFSLVLGFAMKETGLSPLQTVSFAASVLAGTAQLATVQLYAEAAPGILIVLTALTINLRYAMYGLSMEPLVREKSILTRIFYAYIMSDQSYAFTMAEAEEHPSEQHITWFFLGASLVLYFFWQTGIGLGYVLGSVIPSWLPLDFTIPLVFMSLLVPHLKGSKRQFAAGTAALASLVLVPLLPLQSGLLASILIGMGSGILYEKHTKASKKEQKESKS